MARTFIDRRGRELTSVEADLHLILQQQPDLGAAADAAAECTMPLDVVETADAIEIVMDLPGVALEDVTVALVRDTLVISGRKTPVVCRHHGAAFHLAERTFGQCTRGVRLPGAFDASRADARLGAGELRITLPRIQDRRGGCLRIPVRSA